VEEPPQTGWRAFFPSIEERAARRRERIEALSDTESVRARIEIAIGVLAIVLLVVVIVVNLLR